MESRGAAPVEGAGGQTKYIFLVSLKKKFRSKLKKNVFFIFQIYMTDTELAE